MKTVIIVVLVLMGVIVIFFLVTKSSSGSLLTSTTNSLSGLTSLLKAGSGALTSIEKLFGSNDTGVKKAETYDPDALISPSS